MKAKGIGRTVLVVVAAMLISSVLMAAPNAHSSNCATSGTDTAIVGGNGNGTRQASSTPCATLSTASSVPVRTHPTQSEKGNGLARAFGKLLSGLRSAIETATWGGGGHCTVGC